MTLLFIYFFFAVFVSFICSILEASFLSISSTYIDSIKNKSPKTHRILSIQKENTPNTLSAILILNTIAHTMGAAGVGAQAELTFGEGYMFFVSSILTLGILILSEIIPKTLGTVYYKELTSFTAYILRGLIFILWPLLQLTNLITNFLPTKKSEAMSKEEMLSATINSENSGILTEIESDVIENTLSFKSKKIIDILTPRSVVFSLSFDETVSHALLNDKIYRYSRIPVYKDEATNIIGVVLAKELFAIKSFNDDITVGSLSKIPTIINEKIPVSKAMSIMINKKVHLFIVKDSYNQFSGVITLEDCIETILGLEIMDESDEAEDLQLEAKLRNS